ncbi:hypothetical protein OH77DRAFT_236584 [Trametes cingulata]|nr:hypothetical protein OH77DRAFT_236584 [Trametes cingulata]
MTSASAQADLSARRLCPPLAMSPARSHPVSAYRQVAKSCDPTTKNFVHRLPLSRLLRILLLCPVLTSAAPAIPLSSRPSSHRLPLRMPKAIPILPMRAFPPRKVRPRQPFEVLLASTTRLRTIYSAVCRAPRSFGEAHSSSYLLTNCLLLQVLPGRSEQSPGPQLSNERHTASRSERCETQ